MSKLYSQYTELKKKNSQLVYLFKSGIFFIALEDDAILLSNILKLRTTNLNESLLKCGFPVSRQEHYFRILEAKEVPFQIVDSTYGIVENYTDYMNNDKLKNIVTDIYKRNKGKFRHLFLFLFTCFCPSYRK